MLISCTLENWMSFRDQVTFSMVASRERQHSDRVPRIDKYKTRVLPIAAIYGGNASGKSNFCTALQFARSLVVEGVRFDSPIPVEPFLLDAEAVEKPVKFSFELLIDETIYEFSFAVTGKEVLEEKLIKIGKTDEEVLYHRCEGQPNFAESLADQDFLKFIFKSAAKNQLLLTSLVSQNADAFSPVYSWFKDHLVLVGPDSYLQNIDAIFDAPIGEMLDLLDTGITRLSFEKISFDSLPDSIKRFLREHVQEGSTRRIPNEPIYASRQNGKFIVQKLVTHHPKADGTETKFDLYQESDGSQRLIEILPAFFDVSSSGSKKVYVIDELDRSLHTLLVRHLIEMYLADCSNKTRSQVLLTTHDVLLMDQKLLRRDEMWVTERNLSGASTLFSFSEYKDARRDTDIRKSYLQDRLGGTPQIVLNESFTALTTEEGATNG